jgi:arylformamidase
VDAPHHFLTTTTPWKTWLDVLVGPAYVLGADGSDLITAGILNAVNIPSGTSRLLLKTSNSNYWRNGEKEFIKEFVGISLDGAEWIVRAGIQLIGIDYLSIAPYKQGGPTHIALLKPELSSLKVWTSAGWSLVLMIFFACH